MLMNKFGILVFGCTRDKHINVVLESLKKQNALKHVDVWLDGHQGVGEKRLKCKKVFDVVSKYDVNNLYPHNGSLGFRKLIIQALSKAINEYDYLMILEDDCFPTRDAVEIFQKELLEIENEDDIFSIYGHPFLVKGEGKIFTRFQGWGWGTTSKKLEIFLEQLVKCYSMTEEMYLNFTAAALSKDVIEKLDVTYPRQPTKTLNSFFAWDETLALLTVLSGKVHKKTYKRTIFNFGADEESTRIRGDDIDIYLDPPYNIVKYEDIWSFY